MPNLTSFALLLSLSSLFAQTVIAQSETTWLSRNEGEDDSYLQPWQTANFTWTLPLQGDNLTGTLSINRTGAGLSYAGFESHAQTLLAYGNGLSEYEILSNDPIASTLGLSSLHFFSDGENQERGAVDDSPLLTTSTTTFTFNFDPNLAAPAQTLISLFDTGATETLGNTTSSGPSSYHFAASFNGVPVPTDDWTLHLFDAYLPGGNSDTTHHWDSANSTLSINNYTNSLGANFPDNLIVLQTGLAEFDNLTVTAETLASDLVAIGIGGPIETVPEPNTLGLASISLLSLLLRRRRATTH